MTKFRCEKRLFAIVVRYEYLQITQIELTAMTTEFGAFRSAHGTSSQLILCRKKVLLTSLESCLIRQKGAFPEVRTPDLKFRYSRFS